MAQPWVFPKYRFVLMQAIMCLLLGGTVALAALLDRNLQRARVVVLEQPFSYGPFSFRLPADTNGEQNYNGTVVMFDWLKPNDPAGHELRIIGQQNVRGVFPNEFLRRQIGPGRELLDGSSRSIDGHPGELAEWTGIRQDNGHLVQSRGLAFTVILPDPDDAALTILLERNGPLDEADQKLMSQILANVKISGSD